MRWGRYLILLMAALIWCFAIIFFPWLLRSGYLKVAVAISLFFSKLCHQVYDPVIRIGGLTFPVCSRCFALYIGSLGRDFDLPDFQTSQYFFKAGAIAFRRRK